MTTKIHSLTVRQRDFLQKIKACQAVHVRNVQAVIDRNHLGEGLTPSPWLYVSTLTTVHKVPSNVIRALVKKGYLEQRPTDGWGNEVKPVN